MVSNAVISTFFAEPHGLFDRKHSLCPVCLSFDIQLPVSVNADRLWIRVVECPLRQWHSGLSSLCEEVFLALGGVGEVERLDYFPAFSMVIW